MPSPRALRELFAKLLSRARQKNSIYLGLSLFARVLNAVGMFIAMQRFVPATFGELSYLMATAVSATAFSSFGIELSVNAQLTRKLKENENLKPTLIAGVVLAAAGILMVSLIVTIGFSTQLTIVGSAGRATLAVCVYSSFMIITSLLTATSFALSASINVGVSYIITSGTFLLVALLSDRGTSGLKLMYLSIGTQVVAVSYMALALIKEFKLPGVRAPIGRFRAWLTSAEEEVKTLFLYGIKQILVVAVATFGQWLIQRKIVYGSGGTEENAIYSVGNQIFNMMTFIPLIITPLVITRLAAAQGNVALRRQISLSSLKLFAGISAVACVGVFFGLQIGVPFLPSRYAAAVETGLIAALAAAAQIIRSPFSLYFLSELKASREIISSTAGAVFMIIATSLFEQLNPNQGTTIRLGGTALQAVMLAIMFLHETRRSARLAPLTPIANARLGPLKED